jgi:hypothetical protein
MAAPKVSIKWPSVASLERRLKGLAEIERRVVNSRPEPFYGTFSQKKSDLTGTMVWAYEAGKQDTVEGKNWRRMNLAINQLKSETEKILTMVRQQAKVEAKK